MVHDESAVLPAPAAFDPDNGEDCYLLSEFNSPTVSRSSRPFQDTGWADDDHYHESDLPTDQIVPSEWTEKYKDLDQIQVNAAIKRQWKKGRKEIEQVIIKCQSIFDSDSIRREDLTEYFYGPNSPLFELLCRRLGWDHRHFLKWASTSLHLSANQWTVAKLYDANHPQSGVDECI